ncbi:unnamed protein product [Rotaria socialis]|uniref:Uncharacterized protein n=1 Tax=Rotaria socialis TaxID=392032 RepID=A0A821ALL6_9BILA|nr:unnamed protein product [Rotaria socialis]
MDVAKLIFYLILSCATIHAQWIIDKIPHGIIKPTDDYWVIKTNGAVTQPNFPAYIRFYNTRATNAEYEIDCSTSVKVLYYRQDIIFRTTDHTWINQDSYYITVDEGVLYSNNIANSSAYLDPTFWTFDIKIPFHSAFLHFTMIDSDSVMIISDDEQDINESRLYIDENVFDSVNCSGQQSSKSINTGNPFELDFILLTNLNRYQTRSCQTILTSNTSLLLKRNRSTFCQAEYFATTTKATNTEHFNDEEERILVAKKIKIEKLEF